MSFIFCVNVKPTMYCVNSYLSQLKNVTRVLKDMELRGKLSHMLKNENRKLPKFPIKTSNSRRNLLYEMRNVLFRVPLPTPTDSFLF